MEVNFYKGQCGKLLPASSKDADAMQSIKMGELITVNITPKVNQVFHRKIFKLLSFCFTHWHCNNKNMSAGKQFTTFRKMMIIKAGFYTERFYPDGSMTVIPDSLAMSSGTDFPELFSSLLNIAINEIFKDVEADIKYRLYDYF